MAKNNFRMTDLVDNMTVEILQSEASNRRKIASLLAVLAVEFANYIDLYAKKKGMKLEGGADEN